MELKRFSIRTPFHARKVKGNRGTVSAFSFRYTVLVHIAIGIWTVLINASCTVVVHIVYTHRNNSVSSAFLIKVITPTNLDRILISAIFIIKPNRYGETKEMAFLLHGRTMKIGARANHKRLRVNPLYGCNQ
jgi:hypothetical protein